MTLCLRGLMVLLGPLLLAGCGPEVRSARVVDADPVVGSQGLVVIQVVTNAEALTPLLHDFTSILLVRDGDTETLYDMQREDLGLLRSGVFVGSLSPGRYRISHLHAFTSTGDAQYWVNAPVPTLIGSFEVVEGRITRLGTLLVQPSGMDVVVLGDQRQAGFAMSRFDGGDDLDSYVRARYPHAAETALSGPALGWIADGLDAERSALANRIRQFAFGERPAFVPDAGIVIPARLGQIHWRSAEGWKRVETGHSQQLAAVAKTGERYLAGGERGLLLAAPSVAGPWRRIAGPGADEAIYWIGQAPGGQAYVLTRSGSESRAYRIDPQAPDWKPLKRFTYQPGLFFTGRGVMHAQVEDNGDLVLAHNKERHRLSASDGSWRKESSDVFWRLERQRDGSLIGLPGSLWSGVGDPQVSRDRGDTWSTVRRRVPSFGRESANQYWNFNQGLPFVQPDGTVLMPGAVQERNEFGKVKNSRDVFLLRSVPPYKDWRRGHSMEEGCYALLPSISTAEELFVRCLDGRLLRSSDDGETWSTDLESGRMALAVEPLSV